MSVKIKHGTLKPVKVAPTISVSLPLKKSVSSNRLFDYVMLIFGLKKIGKTSLCSELVGGNALFLMAESGVKALSVYHKSVETWEEFVQYVRLLRKDTKFPLVVLDPIDKFYGMVDNFTCKKLVIKHLSDADWGQGYKDAREEFDKQINLLINTGKGVIFISHAEEKKITTRTGDSYELITSTMSKQARETIEGLVDVWAYYQYDGKGRILTILGDDHIGAGHRIRRHFRYTDGKRIRNINMGRNEREAAENLVKAFNNELVNPKGGATKTKVSLS